MSESNLIWQKMHFDKHTNLDSKSLQFAKKTSKTELKNMITDEKTTEVLVKYCYS